MGEWTTKASSTNKARAKAEACEKMIEICEFKLGSLQDVFAEIKVRQTANKRKAEARRLERRRQERKDYEQYGRWL